ncbi:uncharacterized protein LOC111497570 [Cucurbita maxima]|uniref:Uncharacterized protein LOC111497570 n=1 Tax=Cucurbita maxima TaxID=3661 RepID=A0A6J1KYN7_CUCMA|nr:uncharacterized protein LOC111497570 [Cucurbita maxima]XP_023004159.1 uncharacterized protein LOC111497570 [Cucurbita maxima]
MEEGSCSGETKKERGESLNHTILTPERQKLLPQFERLSSASHSKLPKTQKKKKMSKEEEELEFSPSAQFVSEISQCFSLLLSHPLYFSYFLFFSPYLLRLLSFVSPLLATTFLLILQPFFSHTHQTHLDDQTFPLPQHLEWFNTVFNGPTGIPTNPFPLQEPEINKQEAKEEDHEDEETRENGIEMGKKSFLVGCKEFEDDEDKMDLLWEKYEEKDEKSCNLKKDLRSLVNLQKEMEEEEEEEEETGKICCLQALKLSTGKMRFGMGKKSGLKKISKAFKGFKLLHQLATTRKNKT